MSQNDTLIVLSYGDAQEIKRGLIQEAELMQKMKLREAQYVEANYGIMLAQRTISLKQKALDECEALSQKREEDLCKANDENAKLHGKVDSVKTQRNVLGVICVVLLLIII